MTIYGVVGSRTGFSKDKVFLYLFGRIQQGDVIVSGGAKGVDSYAKHFALQNNLEYMEYAPEYSLGIPYCYLFRNKLIVNTCSELIAFWDGRSGGTKYTIDYAHKWNKPVTLISP